MMAPPGLGPPCKSLRVGRLGEPSNKKNKKKEKQPANAIQSPVKIWMYLDLRCFASSLFVAVATTPIVAAQQSTTVESASVIVRPALGPRKKRQPFDWIGQVVPPALATCSTDRIHHRFRGEISKDPYRETPVVIHRI